MTYHRNLLQQRLNESFSKFKGNIAIESGNQKITYNELEKRQNLVAHRILEKGITRGTFIGILVDDPVDVISAMLGILTAGGAFVTLDNRYPQKRLETIIDITDIRWIISDKTNYHRFANSEVIKKKKVEFIFIENLVGFYRKPEVRYSPADIIYVYFTSGTTGIPKGIIGKNEGLAHFINWEIETFAIDETFRLGQFSNPGFEVFLRDTFVPLFAGAAICIPGDIALETEVLIRWLDSQRISLIHCVPSLFRVFNTRALKKEHFKDLKYVLLAGEKLIPGELINWYETFGDRIQLVNLYGPAETTMSKMFYLVQPVDAHREIMPVGKHIKGARAIVLNEKMELCEKLAVGEVCIRTPYRTFGYLNDPRLTAAKFIPNPFGNDPGDLVYKTGDLGRLLPDGNIELLGRVDRQVKIRGMRVELDEIEYALIKHTQVKEAVVIKRETTNKNELLSACITKNNETIPKPTLDENQDDETLIMALKDYLAEKFPDYMVPTDVIILNKLPRNPNGKVNYDEVSRLIDETKFPYVPPTNNIERKLVETWIKILGIQKIGITNGFFELGGNSLNVMSLITKIHKEFDVRFSLGEVFNNTTIEKQAKIIKEAKEDKYFSIEPIEKKEYYALSSAQQRLYFLYQLEKNRTVYNMPQVILLAGDFRKEKAGEIFRKIIKRHESFRTSFEIFAGTPVQKIHHDDNVEFGIPYYKSSEEEAGEITRQFIVPFELDKVPLLRIGLIDIGESRHILMIDMHHIISDRASVAVLIKEVRQLYQGEELPALRNQYKDFSQWQNKGKEKEWIIKQENFWLKEFEDGVPVLDLPTDYARPMLQSFEGDSIDFGIQKEQVDKLNSLAAGSGATMFMVLLAVFNVFFSKLSGQGDIIVGTAIEGRGHEDLRQMIGVFVNTLPLRNYPGGNKTFAVFLDEVRRRTLKAFDNQDYQFEDLVEKVVIKRDASHNPLFDVMFQYEKTRETQERIQGLKLTPLSYGHSLSKFDINLLALESKDHLHFVIDYCTKLFKRETVRRFVTFFMNILAAILNDPSTGISDIDVLPEEEKQQILYDFNDTGAEYPKNKTLYELFAEQAERSPNRIAIKGNCQWSIVNGQLSVEEEHLSYKELNEKSRQLAYLLQEKGLRPDTTAAIMADRSMEMIIGLMGILKAGGAYLPLDPEYPRERIDYMLADSKVNILVKNSKISSDIALGEDVDVIYSNDALHKNPPGDAVHLHLQPAPAASLAYIIYTSGSTGRPKGVLIQHHSVVNLVFSQMRRFNINEDDRVLQFSSLCFDASVEQIFISLFSGAILVLIDKNTLLDTDKFEEFTASHSITHIHAVPSFLVNIKLEQAYHLKRILSGGDVCPVSLAGKLSRCCDFYNRYGPTETTVTSIEMMFKPGDVDEVLPRLPIGKPVNNTFIYLFDKWMKLVPLAVAGELYIGGDGVARGYLNQPELTAEKFLSFFYRSYMSSRSYISKKIYKTGDLGRWLTDGNIEFLGRIDHQVKIKGYRVELGEIESQLLHHERIKEAVVLVREHEPGDKYLYAYVVPEPAQEKNPLNLTELKDYLSQKLPGYMLPSYFLSLEKLPLTPNGKIDRRSLDSLGKKLNTGIEYMAPGSNKEKMIAQTWKDVLKHERIGINDNFFDLGGNSLNIIQIIGKLREQLDMDLSLVAMFEFPTIRTFSQYLSRLNPGGNPHDMKIDRSGAIAAAKKSKLEQQARRKRRN